ncbi:hypothetical protein [Pseudomonas sp. AN-1]|uniref:hypothetical protein n=1 Tax=Pseudomonas sp. AN-1 TaxID=3096605 RepID=UPI002A6AB2BD|nr:hypothetical protein [Pseudomonas sp. AN-1]WPP46629.1 hypothetical protein SK095_04355 [Pseudomonas sp. AN-1]
MEKVYRLLSWLGSEQAVNWLHDMTATPLSVWDLLQLCEAGQCDCYINATDLEGIWVDPDGDERKCTGEGYQKVIGRRHAMSTQWLQLEGKFWEHPIDQAWYPNKDHWEAADEAEACNEFYFKPSDIEALASKMNGAAERTGEAEVLCQELEQERAARHKAELRAEQAEAEAADLRQQLGNAKTAYEALRREHRAAHDGWTFAQAESTRKGYELTAATAEIERLRQLAPTAEHAEYPPETPATGLTFPYATKQLEATLEAALEHWQDFDPDRPPLQKLVVASIVSKGVPVRQAEELARAIKRVDLL